MARGRLAAHLSQEEGKVLPRRLQWHRNYVHGQHVVHLGANPIRGATGQRNSQGGPKKAAENKSTVGVCDAAPASGSMGYRRGGVPWYASTPVQVVVGCQLPNNLPKTTAGTTHTVCYTRATHSPAEYGGTSGAGSNACRVPQHTHFVVHCHHSLQQDAVLALHMYPKRHKAGAARE